MLLLLSVQSEAIRRYASPGGTIVLVAYVRDLPMVGSTPALEVVSASPVTAAAGVFGPPLRRTPSG